MSPTYNLSKNFENEVNFEHQILPDWKKDRGGKACGTASKHAHMSDFTEETRFKG